MKVSYNKSQSGDSVKTERGTRTILMYVALFITGYTVATVTTTKGDAAGYDGRPVTTTGKVTTPILETNVDNVESCKQRLDRMDAISNEKRAVRQDFSYNSGYVPKNPNANMDLWEPEAVCFSEERFGQTKGFSTTHTKRYQAFGDGPKFICGVDLMAAEAKAAREDGSENCLVYNVGSHNQIDYEVSVNSYIGCEVHTFDPTVPSDIYLGHDFSYFHEWGLGVEGEEIDFVINGKRWHWVNKGFDTIVESLGHKGRKIDMLKIDCEGCGT